MSPMLGARASACVLLSLAAVACGGARSGAGVAAPGPDGWQRGVASYYADSLAGRATASGEPYDPEAMTCAHRSLPFGTWIDVVREDGRTVRVRVNDRGPFVAGRVVDLSKRAAWQLGMLRAGTVQVWVRPVAGGWATR